MFSLIFPLGVERRCSVSDFDYKQADYTDIFAKRAEMLKKIREDQAIHMVKRYYSDGGGEAACNFINDWMTTYDPRLSAKGRNTTVPFLLFPRQAEYVTWLEELRTGGDSGVVAKSRDMGVSYVSLAYATYLWLFVPGQKISFGSRKESLVDELGNPDSLLEKVRMFLRYLPQEILPTGYSENKHARHMKIMNPENGSIISGEAGDNIGRGGRSTMYFVDEFAFIERSDRVFAALSQNTNTMIALSTPNGPDNSFARLWFDENQNKFPFHWKDDPRKDQDWYDNEVRRIGDPRTIAQELDLDFATSGEETVIHASWVDASQKLYTHLADRSELPADVKGVLGCDVGGGVAENGAVPRWGALVGKGEFWVDGDIIGTAERFASLAHENGCSEIRYDSIGVGQGVTSAFKRMTADAQGVNVGTSPTKMVWPDGRKSKDRFRNLKAELWWIARERFRKTDEHWRWMNGVEGGRQHELFDLLLVHPEDHELAKQLAQPGFKVLETGKIQIESKQDMRRRGLPSPDRADCLILTLSPDPPRIRYGTATYM